MKKELAQTSDSARDSGPSSADCERDESVRGFGTEESPADVLCSGSCPCDSNGSDDTQLTLEALTARGLKVLQSIVADGVDGTWDGHLLCVSKEGNEADYVYQTCVNNSLVVAFADGGSIHLTPEDIALFLSQLPSKIVEQLGHQFPPDVLQILENMKMKRQ